MASHTGCTAAADVAACYAAVSMSTAEPAKPGLVKSLSLLQASAFNMSNMVGIGIFITVPAILNQLPGPQALLGWAAGALLAMCDGMIWCELGAAFPGSGGSYLFLRETYGPHRWGRLVAFLFIWQFILSGPLEIASGSIGFAEYSKYFFPNMNFWIHGLVGAMVTLVALVLCYRRIESVGKITVVLWIGTMSTLGLTIFAGLTHFHPQLAFHGEPFHLSGPTWFALGASMSFVLYNFLGYYVVCYVGEEVRNPARNIPWSIIISVITIAVLYMVVHLSFMGTLPLARARASSFIASEFMQAIWGTKMAVVLTCLIMWTSFASVFALMLGYSRIPYGAAQDGYFFRIFQHVHPRENFPDWSLLVVGLVTTAVSFIPLTAEITILLTSRILVQFIAQGFAIFLLHRNYAPAQRPFRMWLYPLPAIIAIAGWIYLFVTSGNTTLFGQSHSNMLWGAYSLIIGFPVFFIWAHRNRFWPFGEKAPAV